MLAEFVVLAQARNLPRNPSLAYAGEVANDPEIEVVWVSSAVHNEALGLLQAQLDKSYSLCDAVSFVLMRRRNWIFEDEGAKDSFQKCLFEACESAGWILHAYCIMGNHQSADWKVAIAGLLKKRHLSANGSTWEPPRR